MNSRPLGFPFRNNRERDDESKNAAMNNLKMSRFVNVPICWTLQKIVAAGCQDGGVFLADVLKDPRIYAYIGRLL